MAPCQGNVDKAEYMEFIKKIIDFLSGKHEEIISELRTKMERASENLDFEKAAEIRDAISSITTIQQKQKIVSFSIIR